MIQSQINIVLIHLTVVLAAFGCLSSNGKFKMMKL